MRYRIPVQISDIQMLEIKVVLPTVITSVMHGHSASTGSTSKCRQEQGCTAVGANMSTQEQEYTATHAYAVCC